MATRVRSAPRELVALLAVALIVALGWAIVLPPFQGPDEITHVNYVQQLAETGEGPAFDTGKGSVSTEIARITEALQFRSIIGIPTARPAQTQVEERLWDRLDDDLTDEQRKDGTGPSPLARNPQLYYGFEAVPYLALQRSNLLDRLMAMRVFNVLLFVGTVLLTWLLATELFGPARRLETTVATAVVALWPMLGFMGGVVNPDTALVTAYTLTTWLAVRMLRRGPTLGRVIALCLAGAAAMLVHGRGAPAAGIVLAALVVAFIRTPAARRALVGWSAAGAVVAALPIAISRLALPSSTGGGGLYGGEVYLGSKFNVTQLIGQTWQFYFDRLAFMSPRLGPDYGYRQVFIERWVTGVFAGLEITYPTWVYDVAQYVVIGLLIALWTAVVVHRDRIARAWPYLVVLGMSVVGQLALLHTASYRALTGGPDPLITGRYLLPLTPLVAIALAWLVGVLPRRARGPAAGGLLATLLLLTLTGLGMAALRFHV
jgi:4-amino-4-deoxy-L-arabinose transferase-like glycosyltransferase